MDFMSTLNWLMDWDQPSYKFNRSVLDSRPYQTRKKENSVIITHNCLGIPEENIDISIQTENHRSYLVIQGSYTDEETSNNYSVNSRFAVDETQISGIEWAAKNGILTVEVKFKKPEIKKIPIKKKKD